MASVSDEQAQEFRPSSQKQSLVLIFIHSWSVQENASFSYQKHSSRVCAWECVFNEILEVQTALDSLFLQEWVHREAAGGPEGGKSQ